MLDNNFKVKTDFLNTDVRMIFGIQVMKENQVSTNLHTKEFMIEIETYVVQLRSAYNPEGPRQYIFMRRK